MVRGFCELHYSRWRRNGDPGSADLLIGNPQHGTYNMYRNLGCRCEACRQANTDYCREAAHRRGDCRPRAAMNADRRAAALARNNHGTENRYRLGCRCDECRAVATTMRRIRRQRAVL